MKRALVILLMASFAILGLATRSSAAQEKAQEKKEKATATEKARWHGLIVTISKDNSTITVRRKGTDKIIHYDSSTRWTRGTKAIDQSQFKEGANVICLGKYDDKGAFIAERIDMRREQ